MTYDQFISNYIGKLKTDVAQLKEDLSTAALADLYELGKIQGKIAGLNQALYTLEGLAEEANN